MRRNFQTQVFVLLGTCLFTGVFYAVAQDDSRPSSKLAGFERDIEQGKYTAVEPALLGYARLNPQNVNALELVARMRLLQGRLDEAKALYKRVITLDSTFALAKVFLGIAHTRSGDHEAARQILAQVDANQVSNSEMKLVFAKALMNAGENQRALVVIDGLPVPVQNNEALPVSVEANIALKDAQQLELQLEKAKNARIKHPAVALRVGEILVDAAMGSRAIDLLQPLAPAMSKNVKFLALLAKAEIQTKNYDAARKRLSQALVLEPRSVEVLLAQAMLENAQGNFRAALEILEKAAQLAPDSTKVLEQVAITAIRANDPRRALRAAEGLLARQQNEPEFLYLHGAAALQSGRLEAAQQSLERFVSLRPADSRGCLALGLTMAAHRDRIDAARRQLLQCVEIDRTNYEAKYQLGLSYKIQGDIDTAIEFFEETIAIAPDYPLALRDLGTMYLQKGEESKARPLLVKSVSLDASDGDTHFQLSRLYNLVGEPALARKHLEIFQKLKNPNRNSTQ